MSKRRKHLGLAVLTALTAGCVAASLSEGGLGADCRKPPWYPDRPPSGVGVQSCADERSFRFVIGSGKPASNDELNAFLNAHREEFHAVDGVFGSGQGVCCSEDVDHHEKLSELCISFDLLLCTTSLPDFIAKLQTIQASDTDLAARSIRVAVRLGGLTEPRCQADDPECGPIPYQQGETRPVPDPRRPLGPLPADEKACAHDGECVANGCGNDCDHWSIAGLPGTCPLLSELQGAFCGCVQDRCAWFK